MATPYTVIDASVAIKWFLPEAARPQAVRLLRQYREKSIKLVAPELLVVEVSNVFCKRVRRNELSESSALEAFRLLNINTPGLVEDRVLLSYAMSLSLRTGQTIYDCLYLALALRMECDLITADQKFCAAVQSKLPNVLSL